MDLGRRISAESLRRIEAEVDLGRFGPLGRTVAARIVHATADPSLVDDLVVPEAVVAKAVRLVAEGSPIVVDARMIQAGTRRATICTLDAPVRATVDETRSARAMRATMAALARPALVVVGNAPTALSALLEDPGCARVVLGLCVGFVGAAEAKEALLASGMPAIVLRGRRGGSPVAAAALNALAELADGSADA
jgi:precorrin isomerase